MDPERQLTDSELIAALVTMLQDSISSTKAMKHGFTELEASYMDGREAALEGVVEWIAIKRRNQEQR